MATLQSKNSLQLILCLVFCLVVNKNAKCQLGDTRDDLIEFLGYDYTTGIGDFETPYISYSDKITGDSGEQYEIVTVLYFIEMDNGEQRCTHMKFIYPIEQKESLTEYYTDTMISKDSVTWQDPSTNYLYQLEEKPPFCALMVWLGVGEYSYSALFENPGN